MGFKLFIKFSKFSIFFLVIFAGIVLVLFLLPSAFTKYDKIDAENLISTKNNPNVTNIFATPSSREHFVPASIGKNEEGVIDLEFSNLLHFDGISFYFVGDLTKQPSVGAKRIAVYYEDKSGQWRLFDNVVKNIHPYYRFFSKNGIETSRLQLRFSEPFYYNPEGGGDVRINDLRFYKKTKTSLFDSLNSNFLVYSQSAGVYIFYYFVFLALLLIPGFVVLSSLSKRFNLSFDSELILILSPVFGILALFFTTILFLITDFKIVMYIYPTVSFFLIIEFIIQKLYKQLLMNYYVILSISAALFLIFLVVVQRDYYFNLQYLGVYLDNLRPVPSDGYVGYFVDSLFPWRIARVYLHDYVLNSSAAKSLLIGTTVYDRTPVLPMMSAAIMNLFGEGHFIYQRFLEVLAILFIGAYYSLVRRYYSNQVAIVSLLLVLLNVPIFLVAQNAEIYYKFFSIYPILLALIIFLFSKKHTNIIVGCLLALAFLIHPSTLIYSGVVLILYVFRYRLTRTMLLNLYPVITVLLLSFVSWLLLPTFIKDSVASSNDQSFYLSEASKMGKNFILTKTYNLVSLFIPSVFRVGEGIREIFSIKYLFSYFFLRFSIISNLTPPFSILWLYYFLKNRSKAKQWVLISIAPLLIYWLFYLNQSDFFFQYGGAYFILYPFVIPLCLAFVTNYLLEEKKIYRVIVIIVYLLSMIISLYYLSGVFEKIRSPQFMVSLLSWLVLLAYCSLIILVFFKVSEKNTKI